MANRPSKTCRWPALLAEATLCGVLAAVANTAAASAATATANPAPADAALAVDTSGAMSAVGADDLYLGVTVNGADKGLAHFGYRGGNLLASAATLRALGLIVPADMPDPVRLSALAGVKVDYDAAQQTVAIVAPLKMLSLPTHVLDVRNIHPRRASASPGVLLNYDLYGTWDGHNGDTLSAYTELRAFNDHGVLSSTALSRFMRTDGADQDSTVRLDTNWSTSFPDSMLTLRLGDTLTSATAWSRPTRIGGVQFGTNFALQPYFITAPLPQFLGSATLPSQVELYIDGMKQYSGQLPAGNFRLDTLPNINGAGQAQMVLTNALGQVTTLNFSIYNTRALLKQGLSDWSAELGFVRENYGLQSFDYGNDPVASGTWRRGVSNTFTAEAHGEATDGLIDAGVGGDWLLGMAGVLSGSVARSNYRGTGGSQVNLGYQWNDNRFSFGFNGIRSSSGYRDVAALYGAPPARLSVSGQAGVSLDSLGNFGVSYVQLRYPDQPGMRYAGAYWFKSLGRRWSMSLTANQNLAEPHDRSAFFSLSLSLDNNTYLNTGVVHDDQGTRFTAAASHAAPTEGGWGWLAQWQQGNDGNNNGHAELDYLNTYGQVRAGAYSFGGDTTGYAGANGSLVLMGGHVFAARSIYDSFAVVSTDGVPNVPVQLENNLVGTTDKRGLLLVTPLNAYQNNHLGIDPMSLPADVRIAHVNAIATPADRAGTLVDFGIAPIRAASVILTDGSRKPLPLGSTVRIHGQAGEPALVGYDGAVYLDTLETHNVLDVTMPDGSTCHAAFDYAEHGDGIPQIGPLTCQAEASR